MKWKASLAGLLAGFLLVGTLLSGCGGTPPPVEQNPSFTWWIPLYPHIAKTADNFIEVPFYQELQRRTGVTLRFVHPPVGQETESFNMMVSSGELTDFIEKDFIKYRGGPARAMEEGLLVDLTEAIKQYAPNLNRILEENPDWKKQVSLDNEGYYIFPFLRGDDYLLSWFGPQIRKDILDKHGLPLPETINDWENALRIFQKEGLDYPLTFKGMNLRETGMFIGAYGVTMGIYQDNGVVKYGEMQDAYYSFLKLFSGWYRDGLLDPEYYLHDEKAFDSKVTSGEAGAFMAAAGSGMGSYLPALQSRVPGAELSGTVYPVLNRGDMPEFGQKDFNYVPTNSVGVTKACKNLEAAAAFFDYGYSEEGHMLFNFGIEGESYEMVDGYPTYTELITNNPDGLAMVYAMGRYMASSYGGPFVQDKREYEQYMQYPQQHEAIRLWSKNKANHTIPPITLTVEESNRASALLGAIDPYKEKCLQEFITGQESLENFDSFRQELKKMGIDEVIEIYQRALDRYNSR